MELFYVFNSWENTFLGSGNLFKPDDEAVQNAMLNYWVNFAKTGNPNGEQLENWPQYQSSNDCFLEIKSIPNGNKCGLRTTQCDLWDNVVGFEGCKGTVSSERLPGKVLPLVYPNPSNGIYYFNLPKETGFEIRVYNSVGQIVYSSESDNQINLKNQTNGIYFVELITKEGIIRNKIIKTD